MGKLGRVALPSLLLSALLYQPAFAQESRGLTIASERLALVIGNNAYSTAPLQNPVNDRWTVVYSQGRPTPHVSYVQDPTGQRATYTFDAQGKIRRITDVEGVSRGVEGSTHAAAGRLTEEEIMTSSIRTHVMLLALCLGFAVGGLPVATPAASNVLERGRPVTFIVPYAAGGANDVGARLLAPLMEKELGNPIQRTMPATLDLLGNDLYCGYPYDGLYRMRCSNLTGIETAQAPGRLLTMECYPNPFSGTITFSIGGGRRQETRFLVFDPLGRVGFETSVPAGAGEVQWNGRSTTGGHLPSGSYRAMVYKEGRQAGFAHVVFMK